MSAKPCTRCGAVIVFGKDRESGRIIPLSVGSRVYRVIKENIVELDPKALIQHVCSLTSPEDPSPVLDFTEPKPQE